jgi:hypothetical protein
LSQIVVGPGYEDKCHPYEVWGIVVSSVFPQGTWRYNYCTSGFDSIPNPSGVDFSQIATGAGDVWALSPSLSTAYDGSALNVWEYSEYSGSWVLGGSLAGAPGGNTLDFSQLTVGVNDIWASKNSTVRRLA